MSDASKIRSFIAIELDEPTRDRIAGWVSLVREPADHIRWAAPPTWHITLHFLGDIDPGLVVPLRDTLRTELERVPPFRTEWDRLAPFPPGRRPIVMALHPKYDADLRILAAKVGKAVAELRLPRERRRFNAHLTVGRFRGRAPSPVPSHRSEGAPIVVPVREVTLFESELGPRGAVHHELGRVALTG